jgi:hypothetical protein
MTFAAMSMTNSHALRIARWVVKGCVVLLRILLVVWAVSPALMFPLREILVETLREAMYKGTATVTATELYTMFAVVWVALMAYIWLGIQFLNRLLRILTSCAENDPFNRVNAARLQTMAWLMLAMEGLDGAMQLYAMLGVPRFSDSVESHYDLGISMSGVISVLTLFVLARVFQVGTSMRDELLETV